MKNIKTLILFVALIFSCFITQVEAAKVAVIPLINKVEFNTVEEEKVPNQIFYSVALGILRENSGYMLIENDRLRHAIESNIDPYKMPTLEQMKNVSKKANVDILIAMELTNYGRKPVRKSEHELNLQMDVKANLVTYNRLTGNFEKRKCQDTSIYDATLESRYDKVQEAWTKLVRREFTKLVNAGKLR